MAKLYFRYGTMSSGKSLELLRIKNNYTEHGGKVICLTSGKDNRYGQGKITSRIGIEAQAIDVYDDMNLYDLIYNFWKSYNDNNEKISCILVDESQFFTKKHIYELSDIVDKLDISVIAFGLRSDYLAESFEGSKYLMILSDSIEEIQSVCCDCHSNKGIINARFKNEKILTNGDQIFIGGNESYRSLCRKCYKKFLSTI